MLIGDPLYSYIEYPFKVSTSKDSKIIEDIDTASKCASQCNKEAGFDCRGFNFCEKGNANSIKKCFLSKANINTASSNSEIVSDDECTHFSSKI